MTVLHWTKEKTLAVKHILSFQNRLFKSRKIRCQYQGCQVQRLKFHQILERKNSPNFARCFYPLKAYFMPFLSDNISRILHFKKLFFLKIFFLNINNLLWFHYLYCENSCFCPWSQISPEFRQINFFSPNFIFIAKAFSISPDLRFWRNFRRTWPPWSVLQLFTFGVPVKAPHQLTMTSYTR